MKKRMHLHKIIGGLLALGLMFSIEIPVQAAVTQEDLANPVVDESTHNTKGYSFNCERDAVHDTKFSYVYFGSYPQREIKGEELTDEIIKATYDTYGNGEVNGKRYRRISYEFTTIYAGYANREEEFKRKSSNGYRYYLYEPIKWRIYDNDGDSLFLITDRCVEQQKYDTTKENKWSECDLRRWLNYEGGEPTVLVGFEDRFRYHTPGFLYYAFDEKERSQIEITQVIQDDCPELGEDGTVYSSGEDTQDKIFVLSYSELHNLQYGTCSNDMDGCRAVERRNTDYSRSLTADDYWTDYYGKVWMECYNAEFWLRTVGVPEEEVITPVMTVGSGTTATSFGSNDEGIYVAPAMNLSYTLEDCMRVSFQTGTDVTIEDQIFMGDSIAKEPMIIEDGGAEKLFELKKEGYIFTGWYTDKACTKPYNFDRKLTEDTTLYAGWKKFQEKPNGITGGIMKIQGTTSAMEYASSVEQGAVWTSCQDGNTAVPTEGTWYVRYKETNEYVASEAVSVNVISADQAVADYITKNGISESTVAITDKVIKNTKQDTDLKGSSFVGIQARATKTAKKTIKLQWNKIKKADGYEIYGAPCNTKKKKNAYKLLKVISKKTTTSYTQKKLKKGTYYKYIVRAYKEIEGQRITLAASKTIHATTAGGKYGNAKSVKIKTDKKMKSKKGNYTLTIKKNKKYTIKASEVKQSKKIKQHRKIAFESTNTSIATVTKKGVVKGKKKGTCYIYAYAQNGTYKKIKVKVK